MFCRYCGKQIENSDGVYRECAAAHNVGTDLFGDLSVPQTQETRQSELRPYEASVYNRPKTDRKYGLGQAIAAALCGDGAAVVGAIALFFAIVQLAIYEGEPGGGAYVGLLAVGVVFTVGLMVAGIVLGAKSISRFKEAGRTKSPRPIATLILGIYGIASSATSVIIILYDIIFLIINAGVLYIA